MSALVWLSTLVLALLVVLYKRWSRIYNHWKERDIPHDRPYPLVGCMLQFLLRKKSMGEVFRDIALRHNDNKIVGMYNFMSPDILINDVEYSQMVFVKEFSSFMDRGPEMKERRVLDKHLFNFTGAEWKGVRMKMAPAFTTGRLMRMVPAIMKSYADAVTDIDTSDPELKDMLEKYIMNVSASIIYGLDTGALTGPGSEFTSMLKDAQTFTLARFIRFNCNLWFPKLAYKLGIHMMDSKFVSFFVSIVLKTFEERMESGEVKDDIIQQLLQLKTKGKIEVSQWVSEEDDYLQLKEPVTISETVEITDDILIAQGFVFLMTGLDPLKNTLTMMLVELCQNKRALDKLRAEVDATLDKHKEFSWQALKDMQYLDMCLNETLRMYPSGEFSARQTVKNFTFPNGVTVERGTRVFVPILKFHYDPNFFPEPLEFRPERFETPPLPGTYLPFGDGPRMCIAKRFTLLEMKLFAAALIRDFDLELDPKTELPVKTDKWFFLRRPISPVHVNFTRRKVKSL